MPPLRTRLPDTLRMPSIRTRLIVAFLLLFLVTLSVAVVGVMGMRANQRALDEYEANVVPEIARVLKLSEKVAQVAAIAPAMAGTDSPDLLHSDTEVLHNLLHDIRLLSMDLPEHTSDQLAASAELDGIDRDLTRLMVQSGLHRQLQRRLNEERRDAERAGNDILRRRQAFARNAPTMLNLWVVTMSTFQATDFTTLGVAESDSEALWMQVRLRGEAQREPQLAQLLYQIGNGPDNVFALRNEFLTSEQRMTYLVQLIRAHADQLDARSAQYVEELRQVTTQRHEGVRRVVSSSESGLILLAAVGVVLALLGVTYVDRVLRKLQRMTRVLARLASGNTEQRIPSIDRKDEVGELARAFEVFRANMLEKQKLTEGLDTQQRLLETVFRSMNDGVSVHDGDGRLVGWNPMFQAALGMPDQRLHIGMSLLELRKALPVHARWRAVSRRTATRTTDRHTRIAAAAELHFADQRILEFHCQGMPGGGWVAVCRDLTARRAVEADLRQAQKMEVLGQLTGGVAHDFNNFLVAILGNLEMLEGKLQQQPEALGMAELARRSAERASQLTRRLLSFARRQPLQAEVVPVEGMLAEMFDLIEYAVGAGIDVVLQPPASELSVRVDRGQLENAILNLALNSAAAMPDGGTLTLNIELRDSAERLPNIAQAVVISVTDTGSGIQPELIDKVMEPFFTTRALGEGSGLGLSSVYGFVRQSGGDVQIQSTVGKGTTVSLWLPPSSAESERILLPGPLVEGEVTGRVLVVEDDPAVKDTALAMLRTLGAQAAGVSGADEAQRWLAQNEPVELVLSDISLGMGGNGIALAAVIAKRWPQTRVVLMSGLPLEIHRAHPAWREGQVFLAKPFVRADLAALLA
ncbi:ATP-binding protein [Silvimonas soli]|uniref:ATP-binding protein n=1 Tax=Silvimonas soli TaxID=2980100 RepID=UPI0024B33AEA|nr:ATP-binding protein [Silvimonas soli]